MNRFELPHLDRFIGVDEEDKNKVESHMLFHAEKHGPMFIENLELPKSEKDLSIINFANDSVSEYMKQYGREKEIAVPLSHIHIVKDGGTEEYTNGRLLGASHSNKYNSVIVDRVTSDVETSITLFHELFHAKSYRAMQVTKPENPEEIKIESYRTGFGVTTRKGDQEYFSRIEEGVIGIMCKRFYEDKIKKSPLFESEVKQLEDNNIYPDTTRQDEAAAVHLIIDRIYSVRKEQFSSRSEIEDMFIKAQVNGNLLPIGRLIDDVFGKGKFRIFGELSGKKL